ncbi:alpha-amylase family glycosyl hydrolase [Parabacteroides sp. FAFU027]|uniref:alpha-amylase family glycosyl hydrolase n=1 Tax=Parabacteroides sp. FAFU027 TaxID=2922715 RepID=UPI001FAFAFFE|nr:alpha-amylase family glycosyl hydrolase [Parabacteroides sp. FAFU027]
MKRILLSFCLILSFIPSYTQVVVSNPAFVTEDGTIEITFDATQGNKGMVGATDCYAHTGLITSKSSSSSDWKYAPTWLDNSAKYKMTSAGTDKWKLTISPDIRTYYGVTDVNEFIYKLAFVFRNSTGTLQGKDVGNTDIMVDVYPKGLQVAFDQPANNSIVDPASTVTVSVRSSQSASLNLYLNTVSSNPIAQSTGTTRISYSGTFTAGNYFLIAEAQSNGTIVRDTTYFCSTAKGTRSSEVRPTGLKEGITYNADGSVTFCIYAPKKEYFYLMGDFNDFHPDNNYLMKYQETGNIFAKKRYFWLTLTGLDPGKEYAFQYLTDGSIRIGDPYCEKILDPWNDKYISSTVYPNLRQYPSAKTQDVLSTFKINQDKYQWKSSGFHAPTQNNMMIYELNFRDFTNEGTVNAAIQKLDYIQTLGINAIEMMPITEFDGNDSWGYNPNFYFAPDKAYGTKQDYQHFIDECHGRGIAVIQDVVFNHSWGLSPWCKLWWDAVNSRPAADNPYYNPVAPHPYSVGNDFNHSSTLVRSFIKRALAFWMTEYHIDGFRFDLSKGFTQTQSTEATVSNYDASRISYIKEYADTIKAVNSNAYTILEHFCNTDEEDALAAYKNTMLWRNLNWAFQQAAKGSSVGDFTGMVGTNRVGYPESHDEERLAYALFSGGVTALQDTASAMNQLAACAAFAYLNPGPRMMWQFGELGYDYSINYNGRTGRKPIRWDYLNNPLRKGLHDTYAKVLNFRKNYADLFANPTSWNWQVSTSNWNNGRRIYLTNGTLTAVILANFTAVGSVTANPAFGKTGTWFDLISGETLNVTDPNMSLTLPAFDLKIYTDVLINSVSDTKISSVEVYPNPVTDYLYIKGKQAINIELYSTDGIKVYQNSVSGQAVNLSSLPAGIYIGRIGFEDGTNIQCKICKQ